MPAVDGFLVRVFAVSFVFFVLPLLVGLYPLLCLPWVLPRYRRRRAAELAVPSSLESHYLCSRNLAGRGTALQVDESLAADIGDFVFCEFASHRHVS